MGMVKQFLEDYVVAKHPDDFDAQDHLFESICDGTVQQPSFEEMQAVIEQKTCRFNGPGLYRLKNGDVVDLNENATCYAPNGIKSRCNSEHVISWLDSGELSIVDSRYYLNPESLSLEEKLFGSICENLQS